VCCNGVTLTGLEEAVARVSGEGPDADVWMDCLSPAADGCGRSKRYACKRCGAVRDRHYALRHARDCTLTTAGALTGGLSLPGGGKRSLANYLKPRLSTAVRRILRKGGRARLSLAVPKEGAASLRSASGAEVNGVARAVLLGARLRPEVAPVKYSHGPRQQLTPCFFT